MLKYMTKEDFTQYVEEERFVVNALNMTKFEAYVIQERGASEKPGGKRFYLQAVINPDTKDGTFIQRGGGFNKSYAVIEDIAYYVDNHADDRDDGGPTAREVLFKNQVCYSAI